MKNVSEEEEDEEEEDDSAVSDGDISDEDGDEDVQVEEEIAESAETQEREYLGLACPLCQDRVSCAVWAE